MVNKLNNKHTVIFRRGSRTYFYSSLFFPEPLRSDVFALYAFVRKADDFVDALPSMPVEFHSFCASYREALKGKPANDVVIDSFVDLSARYSFKPEWADAFLTAMAADLSKKRYDTLDEIKEYMYGSAEVIGLFMSKLLGLPPESYQYAQMQGRAMQYINFIRDIDEDNTLGRTYLPLDGSGIDSLKLESVKRDTGRFADFIRAQIGLYASWQSEAEKGYRFIPKRYLIPIKTASDMYEWTAARIYKDPFIIYRKKVKPIVPRIVGTIINNALAL